MFSVGIEPHANTEREWVEGKIAAGSGNSNAQVVNFWSDRQRAFVLATLQSRVNQVAVFVGSCKEALSAAFRAMYPLNTQPTRLGQLLKIFRSPEDMKWCVRHQLIGGAKVALAFVRARYPLLDYQNLYQLPLSPDGVIDMTPHYAAVMGSAEKIIDLSNAETEKILREPRRNP